MALVRLPTPVPGQDFNPRPDLVFFLRLRFISEDQPVILALDGSCLVFAKQELYQKASWAVIASDIDTFNGKVEGAHQTPAALEREARSAPVDNQAVVRRLQAGLQFGCWYGKCLAFGVSLLALHLLVWKSSGYQPATKDVIGSRLSTGASLPSNVDT